MIKYLTGKLWSKKAYLSIARTVKNQHSCSQLIQHIISSLKIEFTYHKWLNRLCHENYLKQKNALLAIIFNELRKCIKSVNNHLINNKIYSLKRIILPVTRKCILCIKYKRRNLKLNYSQYCSEWEFSIFLQLAGL